MHTSKLFNAGRVLTTDREVMVGRMLMAGTVLTAGRGLMACRVLTTGKLLTVCTTLLTADTVGLEHVHEVCVKHDSTDVFFVVSF